MDTVCDLSLERLGHLTQEMRFEEYTYFDLLLRVRRTALTVPDGERTDSGSPTRLRGRGR